MPALPPLFSVTHRHLFPYGIQPTCVCVSDHLLPSSLPPSIPPFLRSCAQATTPTRVLSLTACCHLLPPEPACLLPSLPSCHRVLSLPVRCHFSPRASKSKFSFFFHPTTVVQTTTTAALSCLFCKTFMHIPHLLD